MLMFLVLAMGMVFAGGKKDDSEGKTVLTIYDMYVDGFTAIEGVAYRELIEQFQIDNPDIIIEAEHIAHDAYMTKIQTAGAGDDLPNIFPALPPLHSAFAKSGSIREIGSLIDADPEWKDSFMPGMFGEHTDAEGSIWAMPYTSFLSHVVYYNTEIFEKCGITSFPTTMEEFKKIIPIIRAKGYIPVAMGNKGKAPLASTVQPAIVYGTIDPEWYASLKAGTGASFTDPEYIEAINTLGDLIELGIFNDDFNSVEGQALAQYYGQGNAAMTIGGSWGISSMITDTPREIVDATEFARLPAPAANADHNKFVPGGTGWAWCISANTTGKELDAAVRFLKAMTSTELQTKLIDNSVEIVIKASPSNPDALDPMFAKYLEYKSTVQIVGNPEVELSAIYLDASYTGYQNFSVGNITAEELAEKLQAALD